MSQENVEVVREATDAFNRQDPDALVACLHHDVEWEAQSGIPGIPGVYHGLAEVREWFEEFLEVWESFHAEVAETTETGDGRVVVEFMVTARGGGSGVETQLRVWTIFSFANGKIARRQAFWTRAEVLEAAGLRE
jgi:ketosteroid isomerase-like protein